MDTKQKSTTRGISVNHTEVVLKRGISVNHTEITLARRGSSTR
ncbi:hypothetical protein Aph02nite_29370 [Actinoplanes philippinensis]|uniref:Uncharacterized protein n=1 Tax=Actinoplanes philippinensis TaxID=35752 RepID=A0A1I2EIC4_9ACTN|nr:hypothetical protein [Actinoplanes philippinensis]GIE76987.1 hypothetical protein Aph02nite_29370 [Actinoplanes philippinensis]SFE92276.1 hypothetical protein SAMN05421541_104471 [Actinoplanes philippinensis]